MNTLQFIIEAVSILDRQGRVKFEPTPFGPGAIVYSGKRRLEPDIQVMVIMPEMVRVGGLAPREQLS